MDHHGKKHLLFGDVHISDCQYILQQVRSYPDLENVKNLLQEDDESPFDVPVVPPNLGDMTLGQAFQAVNTTIFNDAKLGVLFFMIGGTVWLSWESSNVQYPLLYQLNPTMEGFRILDNLHPESSILSYNPDKYPKPSKHMAKLWNDLARQCQHDEALQKGGCLSYGFAIVDCTEVNHKRNSWCRRDQIALIRRSKKMLHWNETRTVLKISGDQYVQDGIQRIRDSFVAPSPFLYLQEIFPSGEMLDPFFDIHQEEGAAAFLYHAENETSRVLVEEWNRIAQKQCPSSSWRSTTLSDTTTTDATTHHQGGCPGRTFGFGFVNCSYWREWGPCKGGTPTLLEFYGLQVTNYRKNGASEPKYELYQWQGEDRARKGFHMVQFTGLTQLYTKKGLPPLFTKALQQRFQHNASRSEYAPIAAGNDFQWWQNEGFVFLLHPENQTSIQVAHKLNRMAHQCRRASTISKTCLKFMFAFYDCSSLETPLRECEQDVPLLVGQRYIGKRHIFERHVLGMDNVTDFLEEKRRRWTGGLGLPNLHDILGDENIRLYFSRYNQFAILLFHPENNASIEMAQEWNRLASPCVNENFRVSGCNKYGFAFSDCSSRFITCESVSEEPVLFEYDVGNETIRSEMFRGYQNVTRFFQERRWIKPDLTKPPNVQSGYRREPDLTRWRIG